MANWLTPLKSLCVISVRIIPIGFQLCIRTRLVGRVTNLTITHIFSLWQRRCSLAA